MIKSIKSPKTTYVKQVIEYQLDVDGRILTLAEESDVNGSEITYLHQNELHDTWSVYPPAWLEEVVIEGYEDFEHWFLDNKHDL
jgi:ABC-type Mn2+/Zn2+ transport system ATPase subunit